MEQALGRTWGRPARAGAGQRAKRVSAVVATWLQRHAQRRALLALDDHLLRDIGLTRAEAAREAGKPFWVA